MKVLMTGATGFVGSKLVGLLVERGHEVVVLTRSVDSAKKRIGYPCSFFKWDGLTEAVPAKALEAVEAVVHLAGEGVAEKRWTPAQKRKILESRTLSTRSLVEAIGKLEVPPKVFLSASAIGFYGDRGEETLTESSSRGEGFLSDVCVAWEAEASRANTLRRVQCRIGIVLGEGGGALKPMVPLFQSGLGGPLGPGSQWMSWIHLTDLVSILAWALENPEVEGALNCVSPTPIRNREFTHALARALRVPAFLSAPAFALRLALGEMAKVVLASQRVLPRRALEKGFRFEHTQLDGALDSLVGNKTGGSELLYREQFIPLPKEEIFPFFSDAKNLETLTPEFLGFKVLEASTPTVQEGTLINYRLRLHGMPLRWRTRIEEWKPNERFVDTQLKGPYQLWHHTHLFLSVPGGTVMKDIVRFRVPLGALGRWIAGAWVRRDVESIFNYRWQKVDELFCKPKRV
jgi:uncharacterized protein